MTTKEQIDDLLESSRDFDAWVAEHVFGWKEMKVPADASGENACVILEPPQGVHKDYTFPPKGKLHRGFLTPKFSSDTRAAMSFAHEVGIKHIPLADVDNPLKICRMAMRVFQAPEAPKEQIEAADKVWNECALIADDDRCNQILAQALSQAHAAGVREGIEKATTPTDAMKAHFEGDNEIYQTFEIDGETHILPLRFATVRYVLDEIRALIKE